MKLYFIKLNGRVLVICEYQYVMKELSKIIEEYNRNLFGIGLIFLPLKEYQEKMEEFLSDYASDYNLEDELKKIEEESNDYDEENRSTFLSHFGQQAYERHKELNVIFPNNFRYAFISQVASFVEYELRAICNYYAKEFGTEYILDDLRGSEFEQVKTFLQKSAGLNMLELDPEWQILKQFWVLRKRIVHHQGEIRPEDFDKNFKDIRTFLNSEKVDNDLVRILIPDEKLGEKYIETAHSFFTKLIEKLGISSEVRPS